MESVVHGNGGGGGGLVVTELSHIKMLAKQLEGHLLAGSESQELCKRLTSQISSITERSFSRLIASSVHLDGSRKTTKKMKTTEKRRHQVRVSSAGAGGGDNPVDDGHSWRKYGQKEIHGAKNKRSYYRCTHRHSQGCAATKQVQRTDQDPTLFDVVYLGDHTCVQSAAPGQAAEAPAEHNPIQSLSSILAVKIDGHAVEVEPELMLQGWGTNTPSCLHLTTAATSENLDDASPTTSDSNHVVGFPCFEVAGGVQFGVEEVMSACVEDLDIDSFFV